MSCCDGMEQYSRGCGTHEVRECPDALVVRFSDLMAIPIRDGGDSCVPINFCPWCGEDISEGTPPTKEGGE
jgi:hypothetical protein